MKNIRLIHIVPVILAVVMLSSCKKEFQRINTNPNALDKPDATTLLSNTIVSEFYNNANLAWSLGNGYNQYMTYSQSYYNQGTRYSPVTNDPYWKSLYESARDANTIVKLGQSQGNAMLEATGLTLRSYAFAQLTELWGDIPFSQALKGDEGTFTPAYDNQQTVYMDPANGILSSLRRADSLLKANPGATVDGDILYSANNTSWRKFINALRLRYLLRISSVQNVSAQMQAIVSEGTLMQSADESATLDLPTSIPYNFVSLTERSGDFNVKYLNSLLYDAYKNTGDSLRLSLFFAQTDNASGSGFSFDNYGGMPIVVDATSDQAAGASHFSSAFRNGSNPLVTDAHVMTYAEQEFILAEAVVKGYVTGDAASYYNNGVKGAYAEVGLSEADANSYLSKPNVVFDNSSTEASVKQIITQKWMANLNNGFEGWIEFRRTGYPALNNGGSANLNGGSIPSRFLYPTTEKQINTSNYDSEIQKMGGSETTNFKAWWEN